MLVLIREGVSPGHPYELSWWRGWVFFFEIAKLFVFMFRNIFFVCRHRQVIVFFLSNSLFCVDIATCLLFFFEITFCFVLTSPSFFEFRIHFFCVDIAKLLFFFCLFRILFFCVDIAKFVFLFCVCMLLS